MALVNPYCSVAQVQDELRNSDSSLAVSGGQLETAINQVSRFIDDWKGRDYFQHDHSSTPLKFDRLDRQWVVGDTLWLRYSPIIVLTSVTVANVVWALDTDYIVKEDDQGSRIISLHGRFALGPCQLEGYVNGIYGAGPILGAITDRISLVGKFGYLQATSADVPTGLPGAINKAAILGAAALSGHNQKETVGMDGQKSSIVDKNFPKAFYDLLGKRRAFF